MYLRSLECVKGGRLARLPAPNTEGCNFLGVMTSALLLLCWISSKASLALSVGSEEEEGGGGECSASRFPNAAPATPTRQV
jgi:hypothetical protein